MKTKIRAIITRLRGIEDDLIDLLSESTSTTESIARNITLCDSDNDSETATALLNVIGKDSFHELSEALAKANGIDIKDVGKHIHYGTDPTPIKFSGYGRTTETEIPILDEEKIDTGFNLDFDELKVIPHVPQVEDLAAAIGTKDHPDWFKKQRADLKARMSIPPSMLTETYLADRLKNAAPLTPEELDAQTTKVIHLKEIANKNATTKLGELTTALQKMKTKRVNSKDVGGPVKPPKRVARTEQPVPGERE